MNLDYFRHHLIVYVVYKTLLGVSELFEDVIWRFTDKYLTFFKQKIIMKNVGKP